jgi:prepilin-type processing-associated H-X9-DG protein
MLNYLIRMKTWSLNQKERAFTLLEAIAVIGVVGIIALLFLPASTGCKCKAVRINCASNLKQVALAFRIWEGDNGDHFPMLACTNKTGDPLFTNTATAFRIFQVMSNELNNPKILICPSDKQRTAATNFTSDFNGRYISYFVGLQGDQTLPEAFLAGDSNLTNGTKLQDGVMEIINSQTLEWTKDRHERAGNIALCDGSVQQWSTAQLQRVVQNNSQFTNRLLFP